MGVAKVANLSQNHDAPVSMASIGEEYRKAGVIPSRPLIPGLIVHKLDSWRLSFVALHVQDAEGCSSCAYSNGDSL